MLGHGFVWQTTTFCEHSGSSLAEPAEAESTEGLLVLNSQKLDSPSTAKKATLPRSTLDHESKQCKTRCASYAAAHRRRLHTRTATVLRSAETWRIAAVAHPGPASMGSPAGPASGCCSGGAASTAHCAPPPGHRTSPEQRRPGRSLYAENKLVPLPFLYHVPTACHREAE